MPRSLSLHRSVVTPNDRAKFFERLRNREAHFVRSGCRYWVFEEKGLQGAFVEFCEANDAESLAAAHAASPDPVLDPARIYSIVELS